ncbi:LPS export ABC transporter periplasmic protein LptC [Fretibacter rubidus]|uniref:LPS export ABC transporter periplasmic protein LptC n=1 Tax=Fretibacter rubidus TaxID=570162 RepID=UPI00352A1853
MKTGRETLLSAHLLNLAIQFSDALPYSVVMNTSATEPTGDHSVSEALGLWEPKRTLTLEMARRHSARIKLMRRVLIGGAVVLSALVIWQFASQPTGFDLPDNPEDSVRMINPRYSGRTSDNLPYYLTASEAVREAEKTNAVKLAAPVLEFYRAAGAAVSKVVAKTGVYNDIDKVLDLSGDVDLNTDDGYACQTSQARILARDKAIDGNAPIACQGNFGTVNGNEYAITDNYKRFVFKGGMSAVIERDAALAGSSASDGAGNSASLGFAGNSPIDITAEEARYEDALTTLIGGVTVLQDGTEITSETMIIERAKADKNVGDSLKLGEITTIDARGDFVYITPDRRVSGDRGVYEREKDIITVTGNVKLVQKGSSRTDTTVTGNRLVYNLATKKAEFGQDCTGDDCGRVTFGTGQ